MPYERPKLETHNAGSGIIVYYLVEASGYVHGPFVSEQEANRRADDLEMAAQRREILATQQQSELPF